MWEERWDKVGEGTSDGIVSGTGMGKGTNDMDGMMAWMAWMGSGADLAIDGGFALEDLGLGIAGEDGITTIDGLESIKDGIGDEGKHDAEIITGDPMPVSGADGGSLGWGPLGVDDIGRVSCGCPS